MLDNVIRSFSSLPRSTGGWSILRNHHKGGPLHSTTTRVCCPERDYTSKTIMTKETFGLTQPQSYGYAATVGELQMGFLVSKGSGAVSSYEMFVKWMDKIVGNSLPRRIILRRSLCEL